MVVKATPFAVAKKTAGGTKQEDLSTTWKTDTQGMTDVQRAEREEFDYKEDKVTMLELYSWYGK